MNFKQWLRSYSYEIKLGEELGYAIGVAFLVAAIGSIYSGGVTQFLDKPSADLLVAASAGGRAAIIAGRLFFAKLNISAILGGGIQPPPTPPTNASGPS